MPHWQRRSVIAYKYENSSNLIQVEAGLKGLSESSRMEPGFQIPDAIRNGQTFRTRPGAGDLIQVCILLLADGRRATHSSCYTIYWHTSVYLLSMATSPGIVLNEVARTAQSHCASQAQEY